jgi:ABC-2 type transport system permease protein
MAEQKRLLPTMLVTLGLLALNLIAVNYLISGWSTARIDLTEEGVFSISPATKRILTSLDEDLTIYGYFSKRTHPKLAPLIPEIRDLLDEYQAVSRGRVQIEIIDPAENDAVAQEASDRFGVRSTPFRLASKYETGIVNAYFALVLKYGDQYERYGFDELIQIEPLPNGDIEVSLRNLEYDLTRAMKKIVYGFRSTNELFERVEETVTLTAVMTPDSLPEVFAEVPEAVRTAAEELGEKGGERFIYEEIDPSQDEAQRMAVESRWGLPPMSLAFFGEDNFYLYGLLQIGDRIEQIVLTDEDTSAAQIREAVEASLRRNTPGFLKTVGIVSPSPPDIPPQLRMQMNMPPPPPPEFDEIERYLGEDYQVRSLQLTEEVPSDIDMLLVLKPKAFSDEAVYNLDQYLMRGGRVVLCTAGFEADFNPQGLSVTPVESGLDDWLAHHGVTVGSTLVLDDRNQALPIPQLTSTPLGTLRTWTLAPYPYLVQVREDGFVNPDITATLDSVGIYWGSPLSVDESLAEKREVLPILKSSELSWTDDDTTRVGYVDYEVPAEGTEPQLLAVALSGTFDSFFADKPIPGVEAPEPQFDEEGNELPPPPVPAKVALKESPETRLVVVGNDAFLSDFVARSIGQTDGGFFVENLRFMQNVLDWSSLDNDMLSIRSRGLVSRRLERTEKAQQVTIETINYLIPIGILVVLGVQFYFKRRNATPMIPTPGKGHRPAGVQPSHERA